MKDYEPQEILIAILSKKPFIMNGKKYKIKEMNNERKKNKNFKKKVCRKVWIK